MIPQLLELIGGWIVAVISVGGYSGIAALMTIESACLPLPSELIMPFAGYLVSTGQLSLIGVAIAGAVGCNIGSTIAYLGGAYAGRPTIEQWGRFVLLNGEDIDRAERFFTRFGSIAIFIGRLLPVVRTFIALPAGFARMSMWKFQFYTFVGSLIWCFVLAWLGQQLGNQWNTNPAVKSAFHSVDIAVAIAVVLAVVWFVWVRLRRRKRA